MKIMNLKNIIGLVALFSVAVLALASNQVVRAGDELRAPELPASCGSIQVEAGNKVSYHVYAIGVQVYRWNGSSWTFKEPVANLYANSNYKGRGVGTHYAGPTWESNSGSNVAAARVPNTGCTPDATAIPWLLLKAVSTDGPGIFSKVTYIQRTNTTGGLAPTAPGATVDEEKSVPYTAEYYFYRAED
ncbi:MAG TPA: DUF3455 domain-containing protein [Pyrinomonadaceae bacterium]|nr:DUF3455 domain-containing protein [Pyrinomonadaceae bacterium]